MVKTSKFIYYHNKQLLIMMLLCWWKMLWITGKHENREKKMSSSLWVSMMKGWRDYYDHVDSISQGIKKSETRFGLIWTILLSDKAKKKEGCWWCPKMMIMMINIKKKPKVRNISRLQKEKTS